MMVVFLFVGALVTLGIAGFAGGGLALALFGPHLWLLLVLLAFFSWWRQSVVMVPDGCRAVVTRFGKLEEVVEPAISGFQPDLLLVSAGFDAADGDPIGGMKVTSDGFRELARRVGTLCERRAFVLEGGYNLETLPGLVAAVVEAE